MNLNRGHLYLLTAFLLITNYAAAQTGTYLFTDKTGASGTIAVKRTGNKINAEIFVWWNIPSGRHGTFVGNGVMKNNVAVLSGKKENEDADCRVTLRFNTKTIIAKFDNCMADNLLEDFSGVYNKVTDQLPGNYIVAADKSFFYKNQHGYTKTKAYLVKGDKLYVDLENICQGGWAFINYEPHKGKSTSGYMRLDDLQAVK